MVKEELRLGVANLGWVGCACFPAATMVMDGTILECVQQHDLYSQDVIPGLIHCRLFGGNCVSRDDLRFCSNVLIGD
jgi:hypothetical protein